MACLIFSKIPPPKRAYTIERYFIRAALLAIMKAWSDLNDTDFDAFNKEECITDEICELLSIIQADRTVPLFNQTTFETPNCDTRFKARCKNKNYRRYDIVLRLQGDFSHGSKMYYGLFFECKLLNGSTHGINDYVCKGVKRFVTDSDYAHYMKHAVMLAYGEQKHEMPNLLLNYFRTTSSKTAKQCIPCNNYADDAFNNMPVHITEHRRLFSYPDGSTPETIELIHLWLS